MLDSRRYEVFVGRFARTPELPPPRESLGAREVTGTYGRADLIEDRFRLFLFKAAAQIRPESQAWEYHRLRARGKRARYTIEFLADSYPGREAPVLKALVAVQDILGLHQDADVAIDRLRSLASPSATWAHRRSSRWGSRRAPLPDHDRGREAAFRRRTGKPRDLVEGLPEGNRRESAGSCLQSRVTDWTGDPPRRMIMAPASSAPTSTRRGHID